MDSTPHCSRVVPHPSTERAQTALTSVFGWEPVHYGWYGRIHKPLVRAMDSIVLPTYTPPVNLSFVCQYYVLKYGQSCLHLNNRYYMVNRAYIPSINVSFVRVPQSIPDVLCVSATYTYSQSYLNCPIPTYLPPLDSSQLKSWISNTRCMFALNYVMISLCIPIYTYTIYKCTSIRRNEPI